MVTEAHVQPQGFVEKNTIVVKLLTMHAASFKFT
jgi:hypothetical protein